MYMYSLNLKYINYMYIYCVYVCLNSYKCYCHYFAMFYYKRTNSHLLH